MDKSQGLTPSATLAGPQPGSVLLHLTIVCAAMGLTSLEPVQRAWAELAGRELWVVMPVGLWLAYMCATWPAILAFDRMDRTGRPAWLAVTKIQAARERAWQPDFADGVRVALRNNLLLLPPSLLVLMAAFRARGWEMSPTLPGWGETFLQLAVLTLLTDLFFDLGHRLLHTPWLMKRVHALHHRYTAPCGLASQYQHPVEYLLTGVAPLGLAGLIVLPHAYVTLLFTFVGSLNAVCTHSGYNLPFASWAGHHDLHHARVRGNYGVTGLFDLLFGSWLPLGPKGERG